MTATLELYDGTTTIDLLAAPYNASREARFEPATPTDETARRGRYAARRVEVTLNVKAASVSALRDALRTLDEACAVAERRAAMSKGDLVTLRCQLTDATGQDVEYRVLRGEVALPPALMQEPTLSAAFAAPGVRLRLLVEPFGRLATVTDSAVTLRNEQHGSNVNYLDLTTIGGSRGAQTQIKIANPGGSSVWTSSRKMWIAKRSGPARSDALFFQGETGSGIRGTSPLHGSTYQTWTSTAVAASDASGAGSNAARLRWSHYTANHNVVTSFTNAGRLRITVPGANVPSGLFRALARVRVGGDALSAISGSAKSAMGFALGWSYRGRSKTPTRGDESYTSVADKFQTLDLGEIALSPESNPSGFTPPSLHLDVHVTMNQSSKNTRGDLQTYAANWDVDYVMLLPIDEGAAIVSSLGASDRLLLDSGGEAPGVYALNSSDAVVRFANFTGAAFDVGPESTRIYVVRDEPADPSTVCFSVTVKRTPLVSVT